jgi:ferredoxin
MHSTPVLLPDINPELCIACGACGAVCPTGAVLFGEGLPVRLDVTRACDQCAACEDICPTGAISVPFTIEFFKNRLG